MTPDPLLNSGRPSSPQSWNRYAYVQNNPTGRLDPDGLFDFAGPKCLADQCKQNRARFSASLELAKTLANSLPKGSKEREAIEKALKAIGTEGDRNGVAVAFGPTSTGVPAETVGKAITIDYDKTSSSITAKKGYDPAVEDAAVDVHEGTHVAQGEIRRGIINYWSIYDSYEREAFRAQSYVDEAASTKSAWGLWNPSWEEADRQTLREAAVKERAEEDTEVTRKWAESQGIKP